MSIPIKVGIIGGTGLNNSEILANCKTIPVIQTIYGETSDKLLSGEIAGVPCVILARHGRKHDINPGNVNYRANVWALKEQGCTHILATTATGSLLEEYKPGDLVILDNFIDRTQARKQSFYDGEDNHPSGICHMPMEPPYHPKTRQVLIDTAASMKLHVHQSGTVVAIEGPRFSSKAESLMFKQWGGHVINMTSVPEVVLAKEAGLCYASIALVTDYDCWRSTGEKVNHLAVLECFKKNVSKLTQLIITSIPKFAELNWDQEITEARELAKNSVY